jgi:hypothetical protein
LSRPPYRPHRGGQLWKLFTRLLNGRDPSCQRPILLERSERAFRSNLMAPGEGFPAGFEAGEITAAGGAAVRSGAEAQQQ